MSEDWNDKTEDAPTASELFRNADKMQQEIIAAILGEERQVMHQKVRTKIYDSIVKIIKEHVK